MDLELSDDQFELRDNIRSVLEGACPPAVVRAVYDGTGTTDDLWAQMIELDWPALGVPEKAGGLGFGFVEVGLLAEELGRATVPGPLLAVTTQFIPMLVEADAGDLLAETVTGNRIGALALGEGGRFSTYDIAATAAHGGNMWTISGSKEAVLGGAHADSFAVVARDDDSAELGVFLVEADALTVTVSDVLDRGLGLVDLVLDQSAATPILVPGTEASTAIDRAAEQAIVAMALHTVGASRRIFEMTLEYAKVRVQYDRVIGSFQALKHRFADMFLAVERANAVCYFAALSIAEDDDRRREATHIAKAAAGQCQRLLAQDGLQLHGGIGYTWEHDLHFLLKRAKAGELLCGSGAYHRARLASVLGLIEEAA